MRKRLIVLALASAVSATFTAAVLARPVGEVRFTIENGGGSPLTSLNLSRPEAQAWGRDRLVENLAPGQATVVVLGPGLGGCLYDMKAEFESGRSARLFGIDVCRLNGAEITLTD